MKVQIEKYAWDKIMAFTDLCPNEISGLGRVVFESGVPVVKDVAIFEQSVSGAHSNIEPRALAKFQSERIKAGESMKEWCFWWHSHANLTVFFSGTDTGTIESSTEFPYLVSLVVNKKHESKARLDVFQPVHLYTDLDVEVIEIVDIKLKESCQKEIDKKVTHPRVEERKDFGFQQPYPWRERQRDNLDFHYPNEERQSPMRDKYFEKKRKIHTQLDYLKKNKKMAKELARKQREMEEWMAYGKDAGYEKD